MLEAMKMNKGPLSSEELEVLAHSLTRAIQEGQFTMRNEFENLIEGRPSVIREDDQAVSVEIELRRTAQAVRHYDK